MKVNKASSVILATTENNAVQQHIFKCMLVDDFVIFSSTQISGWKETMEPVSSWNPDLS